MYLGIDGGGTKTAFIIVDKAGMIRARHEEKTSYYIEIGLSDLRNLLLNGVYKVLEKAGLSIDEIDFAFFGLPAYGECSHTTEKIKAIPSSFMPIDKYVCGNDMVCGWAGALACENGINIVAGTGSIAYGEFNGQTARCGGWGEIFSDEGSAYWVAKKGLELYSKMSDGRLEKTALYTTFKQHFQLENDIDICGVILEKWQGSRSKIAKLSLLVREAALTGDELAINIFDQAAQELVLMIQSTCKQLGFKDNEQINISYSGGVFNANQLILKPFEKHLKLSSTSFNLMKPKYQPVIGSVLYAAKLNGFEFSLKSLNQLEHQASLLTT